MKDSACSLPAFSLEFLHYSKIHRKYVGLSDCQLLTVVLTSSFWFIIGLLEIKSCIHPCKSLKGSVLTRPNSSGFILSSKIWPEARVSSCFSGESDTAQIWISVLILQSCSLCSLTCSSEMLGQSSWVRVEWPQIDLSFSFFITPSAYHPLSSSCLFQLPWKLLRFRVFDLVFGWAKVCHAKCQIDCPSSAEKVSVSKPFSQFCSWSDCWNSG